MKLTLITILILFVFLANAQNPVQPKYTLNGQEISFEKTFINPSSIDSISIVKTASQATIQLFSKHANISFLTLQDVVKTYTDFSRIDSSMLFCIKNKLIDDISEISIDSSYFIYVNISHLSNSQYLENKYKNLKIIEIDLEKEKREPVIHIRGELESKLLR